MPAKHPELTLEDFGKVLSDGAVKEALWEIFSCSFKLILNELIVPIERQLKSNIGELKVTIQSLQLAVNERTEQVKTLQAANVTLSDKLATEQVARDKHKQ